MKNATNRYLDAVKNQLDLPSDRKLGQRLEIGANRVSIYRHNPDIQLTEEHALAIAQALDVSFIKVMADVRAERTKKPDVRHAWQEVSRQAGFANVALAMVLAVVSAVIYILPALPSAQAIIIM